MPVKAQHWDIIVFKAPEDYIHHSKISGEMDVSYHLRRPLENYRFIITRTDAYNYLLHVFSCAPVHKEDMHFGFGIWSNITAPL